MVGDPGATLIVVGSINVDLVARGQRMPAPGETILMREYAEHFGGKGGNQAAAAAALGADIVMVGAVGDDAHGSAALADLVGRGVSVDAVRVVDGRTGVAMILIDAEGENAIAVVPGANGEVTAEGVRSSLEKMSGEGHVVLVSLEIPLAAVEAAAIAAAQRGWPLILNPAPAQPLPPTLLSATSILTPNASELDLLGGPEALLAAGVGAIVVTRGGEGADLHRRGQQPQHFPPSNARVVDTTGAGDAFSAALGVAVLRGVNLEEAISWAGAVGSIATEGAGARGSLPTTDLANRRLVGDDGAVTNILAIDQGTSGTKAIVVDSTGAVIASAEQTISPTYLDGGGVEQDPIALLKSVLATGRRAIAEAGVPITAVGLANQGETVLAWDRATGEPLSAAIVWQDRRSESVCADLAASADRVAALTGLVLDPYFSAPKMRWLRDNVTTEGVVTTTDTWLVFRLCGAFVTDSSTASRSLLFNLDDATWSPELLEIFGLAAEDLPEIVASDDIVGVTPAFGGSIFVTGLVVDQQAALLAEACVDAGMAKCTFGTGAFLLAQAGRTPVRSSAGLTTSVAWTLRGETAYCLDGQVYTAASAVRWITELGLISGPSDLDSAAAAANDGVLCVPALAGLAAPWWDSGATASFSGMTLSSGPGHLVRAVLEGIAAQVTALDRSHRDRSRIPTDPSAGGRRAHEVRRTHAGSGRPRAVDRGGLSLASRHRAGCGCMRPTRDRFGSECSGYRRGVVAVGDLRAHAGVMIGRLSTSRGGRTPRRPHSRNRRCDDRVEFALLRLRHHRGRHRRIGHRPRAGRYPTFSGPHRGSRRRRGRDQQGQYGDTAHRFRLHTGHSRVATRRPWLSAHGGVRRAGRHSGGADRSTARGVERGRTRGASEVAVEGSGERLSSNANSWMRTRSTPTCPTSVRVPSVASRFRENPSSAPGRPTWHSRPKP